MKGQEQARILVIDDDATVRRSLEIALKRNGYEVDVAETGKEAIKKSKTKPYNLALIDIRLPDMEDTELLASLEKTTPKMVKIILTGYPTLENAVKAINKVVGACIIKPARTDELLRLIKKHLDKQKQEKEYGQQKVAQFVETRFKELQAGLDTSKAKTHHA